MPNTQIQDVNIEFGDDVSQILYQASQHTQDNRPGLVDDIGGSFFGFRGIRLSYFPDLPRMIINLGFDGVGTKIEVAERQQDYSTVAFDLFAMVCDDAVVRGAVPVGIGTILDVRQLEETPETRRAIEQLARGYIAAAKAAKVVVLNGELAELGNRIGGYGDFNCNWGATVLWAAHASRILTGDQIQAGDAIVGLSEFGMRSNGITDVRKALLEKHGENWHQKTVETLGNHTLGELVARPSTIYCAFVSDLFGGYDLSQEPLAKITGVAHITGGGQPSKIGRLLRQTNGLGAAITDPITPPKIMQYVQEQRGFDDYTAYKKWHMGPGMVITTPEPAKVIAAARHHGITAKQIGEITNRGTIEIRSCGINTPDQTLVYKI